MYTFPFVLRTAHCRQFDRPIDVLMAGGSTNLIDPSVLVNRPSDVRSTGCVFTLRQSKLAGEMLSMICTFHSVPPTASAGEMLRTVGTMQPGGSAQPGIPEQAFWGVRCISLTFNWHLYFTTVAFTYMLLTLHQHSTCISLTFTNILLALYMHLTTGDISQTYKHFTAADNLPRITAVLPQLPERLIN